MSPPMMVPHGFLLSLLVSWFAADTEPPLLPAASADTVRGRVESEAGAPVPAAQVTLVEVGRSVPADPDGGFVFAGLGTGRYSLLVRAPGFAPVLRIVSVPTGGPVTIRLTTAVLFLSPVTVTAMRDAVDPRLATLPADELTPERLRREHGVSLAHVVDGLPGVHTLSTGEQVGKPEIRGLSGSRVLVLADGLRLEDYSWSDEDGPSVDAHLADRIEVIRGPASMLYGSDALGGVVNVIPAPIPDGLGRGPFVRGGIEAYGASNNREAGGAVRLEGGAGPLGWRAMGVGRFAEDLHTPDGPVENTGFASAAGEVTAGVRGAWGHATLRYAHFGGEFKLLEAEGPPPGAGAEEEGGPERKLADERLEVSGNVPVGALRMEAKAQWQRHSLTEVGDEPGAAPGRETTQFDLLLNTATADLTVHHEIARGLGGTVGLSGVLQYNDSRGPRAIVPDGRVRAGALFALERATLGPVALSVGGRVDVRRLEADPNAELGTTADARQYTVASASGGAAYEALPGVTVRANLGRAWRAPTLFELYSNGPRIGEARYEVGRADLEPETSVTLDGGIELAAPAFRVSVSAFRNRIEQFIFLAPTDRSLDGLRVYEHQQAPAVLWGGEAAVDVHPLAGLTLHGQADYVHGTNRLSAEPLPLMPPLSGAVSAEWAGGAGYVHVETDVVARQTRLSAFDVPTDAYALVHLSGGVAPRLLGRIFRVDVAVRNLLDQAYRSYLSRYKEFALDPGRNVIVRMGTDF